MPRKGSKLWPSAERIRQVEERSQARKAKKEEHQGSTEGAPVAKQDQQQEPYPYQDYVDRLVAEAPELTDEQRARIAAILHSIQ